MIVTTGGRFYQLPPGKENRARDSLLSLWLFISNTFNTVKLRIFFLVNVCGLAGLMELRSYNVGFDSLPRDAMNGSMSVTEQLRTTPPLTQN